MCTKTKTENEVTQTVDVSINILDKNYQLDLIKSLIMNLRIISPQSNAVSDEIQRDKAATDKKDIIIEKLNNLKEDLMSLDDPQVVKTTLENIKEDIFEYTGGHRILHEISKIINRLDSTNSLSDKFNSESSESETMETQLREKITFWINKLMVKDKKVS